MKSLVWGALLFWAPMSLGCGAGSKNLRSDNRELSGRLAELRARSRADRQKIRDLENDVREAKESSLPPTDEMIAARAMTSESGDVPSELPVESAFGFQGHVEVVGFDENGVEILYAGDALRAGSIRPRADKYDLSANRTDSIAPADGGLVPLPAHNPTIEVINEPLPSVKSLVAGGRVEPAEPPVAGAVQASDETLKTAYRQAYATLQRGDHEAAVAAFRDFLEQHPKNDYADNAQYWLGEAHYDRKKYRAALLEFHRVVDRYPTGNKVPDALLKIGFCHLALGDEVSAHAFFKNLVKYHPTSNSAVLASGKLQGLSE